MKVSRMLYLVLGAALVVGCSKENTPPAKSKPPPAPEPKLAAEPTPTPAPTPAPAAEGAAEAKPRNETKEYVIELVPPADVSAGAESAVTVTVKPKQGWHFNLEFPTSVKAQVPAGFKLAKDKQDLKDATSKSEEQGATWAIKVTPEQAGEGMLTANVKFAVCTETTCDPKKETLAVKLQAK